MIDDTGFDPYSNIELPAMAPTAEIARPLPPALASEFTAWCFALHNDMPLGDDTQREVFWARVFGAYGTAAVVLAVNGSPVRCLTIISPSLRMVVSIRGNSIRKFTRDSSGKHIRRRYAEALAWLEKINIKIGDI